MSSMLPTVFIYMNMVMLLHVQRFEYVRYSLLGVEMWSKSNVLVYSFDKIGRVDQRPRSLIHARRHESKEI